jgi:hypothetical protein
VKGVVKLDFGRRLAQRILVWFMRSEAAATVSPKPARQARTSNRSATLRPGANATRMPRLGQICGRRSAIRALGLRSPFDQERPANHARLFGPANQSFLPLL